MKPGEEDRWQDWFWNEKQAVEEYALSSPYDVLLEIMKQKKADRFELLKPYVKKLSDEIEFSLLDSEVIEVRYLNRKQYTGMRYWPDGSRVFYHAFRVLLYDCLYWDNGEKITISYHKRLWPLSN